MTDVAVPARSRSTPSGQQTIPAVYLVGQLPHEVVQRVMDAAAMAGERVQHVPGPKRARALLTRRGIRPKGIFIGDFSEDRADFVARLREEATLFDVPVIALVSRATQEAFLEAKEGGVDDIVLASDSEGIGRRLQALDDYLADENPPAVSGTALIAHPDYGSRRQLGWVLRRAGYDLAFAGTREELIDMGRSSQPVLVMVARELLPIADPQFAAEELREGLHSPELPLVVVTDAAGDTAQWRRVPRAAAVSGKHWDRLLFQISEVTRPQMVALRAMPRVFLSAFCAFRPIDQMVPTYAVTYNVSGGGLFVRTLVPPPEGSVAAINLQLPNADRSVVTVHARVAWVQRPTHGCTGPTPDGFGAQILEQDSSKKDLEIYRATCEALHAQAMSGAQALA